MTINDLLLNARESLQRVDAADLPAELESGAVLVLSLIHI